MQFYVLKNNEQTGPFSLIAVRERLQRGEFAYTDLAWREGLPNWTPLKELMGGALPDATPHAVSEWGQPVAAQGKTPTVARVMTAIVLFFVLFCVIFLVAFVLACIVCGGIVGAQAAAAQHAQTFADGQAAGGEAGREFGRKYAGLLLLGSGLLSLILSPIVATLMAFSNLFPWCRKQ